MPSLTQEQINEINKPVYTVNRAALEASGLTFEEVAGQCVDGNVPDHLSSMVTVTLPWSATIPIESVEPSKE